MSRGAASGADALARAGIDAREARLLLAEAGAMPEASVIARPERALPQTALERFEALAARRRAGEPIAYLLGRREFYDLELAVGPAVLIPRPETELLVERALERLARWERPAVLDLGTGSGALALAIKRHCARARVVAVEASGAALELAQANARRLGLEVDFRAGRWFAPVGEERFELIVSNPPYVAEDDPHLGQGDLRFEPRAALVAGPDGLDAIREIVREAPAHLVAGGWLLLEHGLGQDARVRALLEHAGLEAIATWSDLAGIPRVSGGRAR
ncbi:MAG: peptide chain release factor N(5)-glutamine methyltransferase [Betaproteobacteria bacterium]|nr:peptide chain release factor N(5)-glutamine methyltransferase [Betaproteobacteria bacterium]